MFHLYCQIFTANQGIRLSRLIIRRHHTWNNHAGEGEPNATRDTSCYHRWPTIICRVPVVFLTYSPLQDLPSTPGEVYRLPPRQRENTDYKAVIIRQAVYWDDLRYTTIGTIAHLMDHRVLPKIMDKLERDLDDVQKSNYRFHT